MTRTTPTILGVIFLLILSSLSIQAQRDWKISALRVTETKAKMTPALSYNAEQLKWANVVSDCVRPREVTVGKWFSLKPKANTVTINVKASENWGTVDGNLILYVGKVVDYKGDEILKEVACSRAESKDGVMLSFNDLEAKTEYYILVSGEGIESRDRFTLHISSDYQAPEVSKPEPIEGETVVGRITSNSSKPMSGVLVTLLNAKMKPVQSATSDEQGMYRFEKLPLDEVVLSRIELEDADFNVEIYKLADDGSIKSRARKIGNKLYSFDPVEDGFNDLVLLSERDWKLDVSDGKIGIAGRLVVAESYLFGIPNTEIGLYNSASVKTNSTKTDAQGNFQFEDLDQGNYNVRIENMIDNSFAEVVFVDDLNVPYEYSNTDQMDDDGFFEFSKLPADVVKMKRMEVEDAQLSVGTDFSTINQGEAIALNNILFATGSSELDPTSYPELDKLAEVLKKNEVRIEIAGHTDNRGAETSNLRLSQGRADAVMAYLISKGVKSQMLEAKGYGEAEPISSNETESGRKTNRRVTIRKM